MLFRLAGIARRPLQVAQSVVSVNVVGTHPQSLLIPFRGPMQVAARVQQYRIVIVGFRIPGPNLDRLTVMLCRHAFFSISAHHHAQIIVGFRVVGPHLQGPAVTAGFLFPVLLIGPDVSNAGQERGFGGVSLTHAGECVLRRRCDLVEGPLRELVSFQHMNTRLLELVHGDVRGVEHVLSNQQRSWFGGLGDPPGQIDGPADPGIAAVQTRGVAEMATKMQRKFWRLFLAGRPVSSGVPSLDQLQAELEGRVGAFKDEKMPIALEVPVETAVLGRQ